MVNRNLLRQYDLSEDALSQQFAEVMGRPSYDPNEPCPEIDDALRNDHFDDNKIVHGTILNIIGDDVIVDIGFKSDGIVPLKEWKDESSGEIVPPTVGTRLCVLLESLEDESGAVVLSYRKALRHEKWQAFLTKYWEGDVVAGVVTRKIVGGLLVHVDGVNVFLPASQVDIRRPLDIKHYIGRSVEGKLLKIDHDRRTAVMSRRQLIEEERLARRSKVLAEIEPGQIRKGIVRNVAEFGAFVDLGGIDGLLHISDMSWNRVNHPHDLVKIDQEIDVFIIKVDKEREKISLGLKQKTKSPWEDIATQYPVGSRHIGEVVNVMPYGAFVKLESGIEGLVHISEMSWTRRINHPSELVSIGDPLEVQVLNINKDRQELSLGMKQTQPNPWDKVAECYPPGTKVEGIVRNLTNYGAFIEIDEGIDGLVHISDMSWVRKPGHPSEMLNKGDRLRCIVLSVDQDRRRIALGLKQLADDPWEEDIPSRYHPGDTVKGKVTKITNFGVFVELELGLEGLLHSSELTTGTTIKQDQQLEVRILRVDPAERKIGLR